MGKNFYISDLHLGHENVIRLDGRPFSNADEMTEEMVKRWNEAVTNADVVYILGDFSWKKDTRIISSLLHRLNGKKLIIKGNHDRNLEDESVIKELRGGQVVDYLEIRDDGRRIVMSHYPLASWNRMYCNPEYPEKSSIHLYGHVHSTRDYTFFEQHLENVRKETGIPAFAYNVGCMMPWMDYRPRTLKEIVKGYEDYKSLQ